MLRCMSREPAQIAHRHFVARQKDSESRHFEVKGNDDYEIVYAPSLDALVAAQKAIDHDAPGVGKGTPTLALRRAWRLLVGGCA